MSLRRSMSLHAVPWAYMKLHELACNFMQFLSLSEQLTRMHAGPWACIQVHELVQVHELACSSLSIHEVTWACMPFHAVPFFVWAAHKNFAVLVILFYKEVNIPHLIILAANLLCWFLKVVFKSFPLSKSNLLIALISLNAFYS